MTIQNTNIIFKNSKNYFSSLYSVFSICFELYHSNGKRSAKGSSKQPPKIGSKRSPKSIFEFAFCIFEFAFALLDLHFYICTLPKRKRLPKSSSPFSHLHLPISPARLTASSHGWLDLGIIALIIPLPALFY